jgi:hypothetical protein
VDLVLQVIWAVNSFYAGAVSLARPVRMMVMPTMAVVMVVVVALVMMELTMMPMSVGMHVMEPGSVAVRTMVVVSLVKPRGPLDLLKFGMQHHGHSTCLQVSHG